MLYRVVLLGHVAEGADLDHVKREFIRVTGLPLRVAEQLFAGTRRVIKRQISEADAERIAETLRAIGAPATIECETPHAADAIATPTVSPATAAVRASVRSAAERGAASGAKDGAEVPAHDLKVVARRRKTLMIAAAVLAGALALLAAPAYDEFVKRVRDATQEPPRAAAVAVRPAPHAEAESAHPVPPVAAHLHGPWRCTDQSTGVSSFWRYADDGRVMFQGETDFVHGEKPLTGPDVPTRWSLEGNGLTWTYDGAKAPATVRVLQLSLMRFDYRSGSDSDVFCRRP